LLKGRKILLGSRVEIVEFVSDLVITVRGSEVPTFNVMIAQSDHNSERHPDSVGTADNGSSNAAQIARLAASSIDVIVTDHHALLDGPPPSAAAVINPVRSDCEFPDKSIAGCSAAFMLMFALREKLIELEEIDAKTSVAPILTFCGVGFQADCVHLGKSMTNRTMVRFAISIIQSGNSFVCWDAFLRASP
jgi:single-stranded-DNA-specific exonuclease